jgi:tryptophanyl-tRNA synthetase
MTATERRVLDPWAADMVEDYKDVMKEFGIGTMEPDLLSRMPRDNHLFRRGIVFAQRDLGRFLKAEETKKLHAVMSGIKPSNILHIGNYLVLEEIKYFQDAGAAAHYAVADLEAYCDNGTPLDESFKMAVDNVSDLLAVGVNPKKAHIYMQSREKRVTNLGFIYSRNVTHNMLRAIYGEKPIGLYMSALTQVGDILLPEMEDFGGPKPVLVPIGIDQDPHMRLTRDIAAKHDLVLPSSMYHKFIRSLTGQAKMSKRDPMGMITLSEDEKSARKKIMSALTGGRNTVEEQKKLGGEPQKCVIYELYTYFQPDDKKLKEIFETCTSGARSCGDCKKQCADFMVSFLQEHQAKKAKAKDAAKQILEG